jgi:hypothetical protein
MDGEEKERRLILSVGEIKGILLARFTGTHIGSPASSISDRDAQVTEGG